MFGSSGLRGYLLLRSISSQHAKVFLQDGRRLLGLRRLRLLLGEPRVGLGLLGEPTGVVVVLLGHRHVGAIELVLRVPHLHRRVFAAAGAEGVGDRGLRHGELLSRRRTVRRASAQDRGGATDGAGPRVPLGSLVHRFLFG